MVNSSLSLLHVDTTKQYSPHIIIPEFLDIDEELAWAIGFYLAEGTKSENTLGVSNSEINLVLKFKDILESHFNIPESRWYVYLHSNNVDDELRSNVSNILNVKKVKFVKGKLATKANIDLRVNNRLLVNTFNQIIDHFKDVIQEEYNLALAFIKGYTLGDGSVIQRKGYLYGIAITVKNKEYKNLLEEAIFKVYNIKPSVRRTKECYEIILRGIHLMTKVILDEHFKMSCRQWSKLIRTYLRNQYVRSHVRYWRVLRNKSLSAKELALISERSYWAVRDAMRLDEKMGLVNIERRKVNKTGAHLVFYSLTDKCKDLLKLIGEVKTCETQTQSDYHGSSWT